uniref:Uncharacterized protein n=1 Tax=Siphoviridae sp. ct3o911 TaxID=2827560 RepID=A0A8S5LK26_9CAUD|nr:MAG TPA: hypothetical protein [Siphoviridae sp. ct3o911]
MVIQFLQVITIIMIVAFTQFGTLLMATPFVVGGLNKQMVLRYTSVPVIET